MNQYVLKMCKDAGFADSMVVAVYPKFLKLAQLVQENTYHSMSEYKAGYADGVLAEREECAKLCDDRAIKYDGFTEEQNASEKLAEAIRARGEA